MLRINKRQSEIYQLIKTHSNMSVKDLLPHFPVSAATVRKDLTILEESGLVIRTHGEVHLAPHGNPITPFEARSSLHNEAKLAIARAAAREIRDGESVILDSGTTTAEIAKLLADRKNLTVITNSLPVATALSSSQVSVLIVGGIFLGTNLSIQGPEAEQYFRRIEADRAFLSSTGVRRSIGLVSSNPLEASIKKSMIGAARKTYAVLDSSKFHISSVNLFADFSDISAIITEKPVEDAETRARLLELGVECILAE